MTALIWGVKESFRRYVEASGGTIAASDGAERSADGAFVFAAAAESDLALGDDGAPSGTGRFRGVVRFQAHGGLLSVTLADPWVEPGDGGGYVLSIAETATRRTAIAKLDVAGRTVGADGATELAAVTTLDGMMILGDHYPPGTALDPVRLVAAG